MFKSEPSGAKSTSATRLIVVDNFYTNPNAIRELALRAEYFSEDQCETLSGQESIRGFHSTQLMERLSSLVGTAISVDGDNNAFGRFRYSTQSQRRTTKIHFDNTDWTGVIYLTPEEVAEGGTIFCRHKETGLSGVPTKPQLMELGFTSLEDFDREIVMRDSHDDEKWEIDLSVRAKFNRLVLFRGSEMFHGAASFFGTAPENARLTQVFFFNEIHASS